MDNWTPDELQDLLDKGENVFLKFWKKGCGICKLSTPATDRLEEVNEHNLRFGKILIDDHPEMLDVAETEILPVFFVFKNKKLKGEYKGFKGLKALEDFLRDAMKD